MLCLVRPGRFQRPIPKEYRLHMVEMCRSSHTRTSALKNGAEERKLVYVRCVAVFMPGAQYVTATIVS